MCNLDLRAHMFKQTKNVRVKRTLILNLRIIGVMFSVHPFMHNAEWSTAGTINLVIMIIATVNQ